MTSRDWIALIVTAVGFTLIGIRIGCHMAAAILSRRINEQCSAATRRALRKEMGWQSE